MPPQIPGQSKGSQVSLDKRGSKDKNADITIIKVLNSMVLVEPDFGPTQSESGILLKTSRQTAIPDKGWILALDDTITHLEIGDYVYFDDKQSKGFWAKGVAHIPLEVKQIIAINGDKKR